jgi:hypothetical protein
VSTRLDPVIFLPGRSRQDPGPLRAWNVQLTMIPLGKGLPADARRIGIGRVRFRDPVVDICLVHQFCRLQHHWALRANACMEAVRRCGTSCSDRCSNSKLAGLHHTAQYFEVLSFKSFKWFHIVHVRLFGVATGASKPLPVALAEDHETNSQLQRIRYMFCWLACLRLWADHLSIRAGSGASHRSIASSTPGTTCSLEPDSFVWCT